MLIRFLDKLGFQPLIPWLDARGFPTRLPEFQPVFPHDEACAKHLETMRWPDGFICPKGRQQDKPCRFPTRSSAVLRCRRCKVNASLTASTVMPATPPPLSTWFWARILGASKAAIYRLASMNMFPGSTAGSI